jgi:hypothetical protein
MKRCHYTYAIYMTTQQKMVYILVNKNIIKYVITSNNN